MKRTKLVSLILAVCMVLSVFMIGIASVSAAEEQENNSAVATDTIGADEEGTTTETTDKSEKDEATVGATDNSWVFDPVSYYNLSDGDAIDRMLAMSAATDSKYFKYNVVQIIATKPVSGTKKLDYVFLCYRYNKDARTVSLVGPQYAWEIITVKYSKTSNSYLRDKAETIDISNVKTASKAPEDWVSTSKTPDAETLAELPNLVSKALTSYSNPKLNMIAQLGTQTGDETNRRFLCYGTKDSKTNLYVVDVNEKDDQAQVTKVSYFDLASYVPATSTVDTANNLADKTAALKKQNDSKEQQSVNTDNSTKSPKTG